MQSTDPDELLREAMEASQRNDTELTLKLLTRASEFAPLSAIPHLLMGGELAQSGRYAEAEGAFARAVLADPKLSIARFQLGLLQFTSGNVPMAMLSWQPLTDLGDQNPLSLFVQGFAQLAQDNITEAARLFHAGIEINTDNAPLNADIRMVLQRMQDATNEASQNNVASEADEGNVRADTHVLLSNYGSLN